MNIGMILDQQFPVDLRVEHEGRILIEQGHTVFLFCVDYSGRQALEEIADGIQVKRKSYPRWVQKLSALAYSLPFYHLILQKAIKDFVEAHAIQVLHVHDMTPARAVFWVNKKFGLPVVLDLHENRPEIMKFYGHVQRFPGKLLIKPSRWKSMEEKFIRKSDRCIVVTEEAKSQYVSRLPSEAGKIAVVPNTVTRLFYEKYEINEAILDKYSDKFMILYIGDTGVRRGLETVIRAIHKIREKAPDLLFCILGEGNNNARLKALTKELGIEGYVDFEGWKPPRLFHSYILASSVCTCPILRNMHHDTTYANKLFQYAALGAPQLVSDCPSQKNLIEKYNMGLSFVADDPDDCAEKIMILYTQPEKTKQQGENGKKAIRESLTAEIVSRELVELYSRISKNSPSLT